jgi:predicted MPP superfamily phosphohydrolase
MGLAGYLLFLAAWVGHSALWLVALNVIYSRPLHRELLKAIRWLVALLVFGFPAALWCVAGLDLSGLAWPAGGLGGAALTAYLALCWAMSLAIIPLVTVCRQLAASPPALRSRRSEIIDTTAILGSKPAGDGKWRRMACLPGNQVFQVEFTELTLGLTDLPAEWDGLTILHLSDLHLSGTPSRKFYQCVLDRCVNQGPPDILAITGDLVDSDVHHRWLLPLLHPLRWKEAAFAILGNHDVWHQPARLRRRLNRLGITVVGNTWTGATVRGVPLIAIGHEGPWFGPGPDLSGCSDGPFRLCLSHTPDNIRWARRNGIHLMLSGHNHGGQIRLLLFGSLFVPSLYSRTYDCGLFWKPPTLLHVNRGLAGKEPLRYNCRPEVTRIVLKQES